MPFSAPIIALRRPPPFPSLFSLFFPRPLSTAAALPALDLSCPTVMVWGANTGVGKTLVSTGLAAAALSGPAPSATALYVKPLQTGFPRDSDARFVYRKVSDLFRLRRGGSLHGLLASNHALRAWPPAAREVLGARTQRLEEQEEGERVTSGLCWYEEKRVGGGEIEGEDLRLVCKTLYGWREAVSPHLAVEREGMAVEDSTLREVLERCLRSSLGERDNGQEEKAFRVIETAGGVASPGPSGTFQCDLYRFVDCYSSTVGLPKS